MVRFARRGCRSSSTQPQLTAPAVPQALDSLNSFDNTTEICPDCVTSLGLCPRHVAHVCPQLAQNVGWLKLMGEARTEQTKRQAPKPGERVAIEKVKRRNARKVARSNRRGYFGLAKAIMERKAL